MNVMRNGLLLLTLLLSIGAQLDAAAAVASINPALLSARWPARWIAPAEATTPAAPDYQSPFAYGVYHFRRTFELSAKPNRFVVHVSADQRYQLFVNGARVVWGPARADLKHWRYESVDIASHLRAGKNVLAAVVWNFAEFAPVAQNTFRTAFLLQGDSNTERIVDTGKDWRVLRNNAYQPREVRMGRDVLGYWAAGASEEINAEAYPWGWEQRDFDDSKWSAPQLLSNGSPRDSRDAPNPWMLVPRAIPLMEEKPLRIPFVRQVEGPQPPGSFPLRPVPHPIQANRKTRLILDQGELTTGYPELLVSGGRGATITLRYAEGLYEPGGQPGRRSKGNRNETEGKDFVGYGDVFHLDGGASRVFRPLWWRTWRYIELTIETKGEALTVEDLAATYVGYPFERKSTLSTSDKQADQELQKVLEVGWRTARLCAHETYMDCPYYEQLQYGGDTRIQALVSLYTSGDARLMKQAIDAMDATRTPEGLTYSRAPSELQQYIPPFSLWWIGMVHDFWMHVDDPAYVKANLRGVRAILRFYEEHQEPTGSLGKLPWWNFVDWAWPGGVPPNGDKGNAAALDLQLLLALDWAAEMEDALGSKAMAVDYRERGAQLRSTIQALYWDGARGLYADTPQKDAFSQQANSLAILAKLVEGDQARKVFDALWTAPNVTKSTVYFRFYTHAAARAAGLGDRYLGFLDLWRDMLKVGLTTWAEMPEPTRSDCHAWSASPNFELFRTMLGIASDAPGFRKIRIAPNLGPLNDLEGSIPHPRGEIRVKLEKEGQTLTATTTLPEGTEGTFVWNNTSHPLHAGENKLRLP